MEDHEPMVSVVMPVYDASEYLSSSIGDILGQSYVDFELICVDDGSTDGSGKILEDYANRDTRIRVIHQNNRGGGAARNTGLRAARGKYLLFLDSDDRFEKELMKRAVEKAEAEESDIVVYDGDVFDHVTGERRDAPWLIREREYHPGGNPFLAVNGTVWNKLFLREYVSNMELSFTERRAGYSTSFVALALLYTERISILNHVLVHYRVNNPNSNMSNEDKDPTAIVDALLEVSMRLCMDGTFEKNYDAYGSLCEESILSRLKAMRTASGFTQLYKNLHNGGILSLYQGNSKESIEEIPARCRELLHKTESEYLFDKLRKLQTMGLLRREHYQMPRMPLHGQNLALAIYGGGNVGKDYFIQIIQRRDYCVVAWVDRNYEHIGFPLQPPEVLRTLSFDFVLIAVLDKKIADNIRQELQEMEIPVERIYWEKPVEV